MQTRSSVQLPKATPFHTECIALSIIRVSCISSLFKWLKGILQKVLVTTMTSRLVQQGLRKRKCVLEQKLQVCNPFPWKCLRLCAFTCTAFTAAGPPPSSPFPAATVSLTVKIATRTTPGGVWGC